MAATGSISTWTSAEAQAVFRSLSAQPPPPASLDELRCHYDRYNRICLDEALGTYACDITETSIAGVPVHRVLPVGGLRSERLLLCVHGGAFMWGDGAGAVLEAVPVAATTGCEVLAIDYRLAPEHPFPAAVDDVLAVYIELLGQADPSAIAVYGCSAGGLLSGQAIAAIVGRGLPPPGAAAMLHGAALDFGGDAPAMARLFDARDNPGEAPSAAKLSYFDGADLSAPLVLPGNHPDVLASFPPSLLVSGTRDFAASACATMHRRLLAVGVEAEFVLFDGMWHAHHMATLLPESREVFNLLARFFDRHLT